MADPAPTTPTPVPITITTPRLTLITPDPTNTNHADFIVHLYNTPEFIASIGGKPTSITTRDAAQAYIRNRFVSEHARNGYGTWLVALSNPGGGAAAASRQDDAGEMVGTVSLSRGPPESGYAAPDLGFAVLPEYCRRGIATEASRALLAWARREKGVDVVLGLHDPVNEGSAAVLRGLGFERKGLRKLSAFGGVVGLVWTLKVGKDGSANGMASEDEVRSLGLPAEEGDKTVPAGVA